MKTSKLYFFAIAFIALSISMLSCSSDDGEDGLVGPQGVAGEVGPAGDDGSIIYSGEGEATASLGTTGDYYLNIATGMLYGPKVNEDNWTDTDGLSLVGEDGTDGAEIFSGEGVPSNNFGNTGDFYLDITNSILYGPAVTDDEGDTTWGAGLELKGADGNANVLTYTITVSGEDWSAYQNADTYEYKWMSFNVELSALTEDIYDNGFVLVYTSIGSRTFQLPWSSFTTKKNLLTRNFNIQYTGDVYSLQFVNSLEARNDFTELLTLGEYNYKIIVVSGSAAVQLSAIKDNPIEFEKLLSEL
jgi:hypothetical protein